MHLMIDNYDSFTYNLVHYFEELGAKVKVALNDQITLPEIHDMKPESIIISPGPKTPGQAGLSLEIIKEFAGRLPILGVCLGHQAIGRVFGGKVVQAPTLMHGRTSKIQHQGEGLFKDLPSPFTATRYHSLTLEPESFPNILKITAKTREGVIMGLEHREMAVFGVQFHPESLLTEHGHALLQNFLKSAK